MLDTSRNHEPASSPAARAIWLELEPPMMKARDMANAMLLALAGLGRQAMSDEEQREALSQLAYEARDAIKEAIATCEP
jgi:hypothetical protein